MKRMFLTPLAIVIVTVFVLPPGAASAGTSEARMHRLFRALKALPSEAADADRVQRIVTNLVTLDPVNAIRYYRVGYDRLSNMEGDRNANATKLMLAVLKVLKKSKLSPAQRQRINKRLFILSLGGGDPGDGGGYPGGPPLEAISSPTP